MCVGASGGSDSMVDGRLWVVLPTIRRPAWCALRTRPDGCCDLIGACARGPVTVLSARLTGACRPYRCKGKDGSFRMVRKARKVTGGVDTHGETHHAAVVD